jgi:hypothetical protein
MEPDSE